MFEHNLQSCVIDSVPASNGRPLAMSEARYAQDRPRPGRGHPSGRFPVGSLLPTELELCERYDASRHTVRGALPELQELGLVSRRKNVGTRVEAARPRRGFASRWPRSRTWCSSAPRTCASCARSTRWSPTRAGQGAGLPGGTRWLRISSLRMDGGGKPRRSAGPTSMSTRPTPTCATSCANRPEVLISALIEARYGRAHRRIRQDVRRRHRSGPAGRRARSPTPARRR